ncbi:MAG: FAD-dependent monooxygenase [Legionellaceae bacterium]|nr:FAD-dependent monooxygenase [Legionellaceae bacterium]
MVEDVDVLIIGGGLIGMALMLALKPLGYRVRMVEARVRTDVNPGMLDTRSIALSPASIRILEQLHVWPDVKNRAASINMIHVSEQGRFGQARLNKGSEHDEPLGAVVEMHELNAALHAHLNPDDILIPAQLIALDAATGEAMLETSDGEKKIKARWVIAADGANSSVRKLCHAEAEYKTYPEHALAANIKLSRPHGQVAYERFTSSGPLALLPLPGPYMSLVWTRSVDEAARLKLLKEADFLSELQRAFGYRVGRFAAVGQRMTYPLRQVMMHRQVHDRVVFLGNAAHTLHPVAGQGFNLGLRDVAMLAQCAAEHGLSVKALTRYQIARVSDQEMIMTSTDALVSLFKNPLPGIGLARRLGLVALDNSKILKNMLLRHAKGFGGVVPDLVCGIPLKQENV